LFKTLIFFLLTIFFCREIIFSVNFLPPHFYAFDMYVKDVKLLSVNVKKNNQIYKITSHQKSEIFSLFSNAKYKIYEPRIKNFFCNYLDITEFDKSLINVELNFLINSKKYEKNNTKFICGS
jgi:hypothetical protein